MRERIMSVIKSVGIVGAGQMGAGIAQVSAQAGYDVLIHDVSPEAVAKGIAGIGKGLSRLVAKDALTQADADAALARIKAGTMAQVAAQDLAIEAATENEAIKKQIFQELAAGARAD